MAKDIELVIFDLDGTIVELKIDWDAIKNDVGKHLFEKYGIRSSLTPLDSKLDEILSELGEEAKREVYEIVERHELRYIDEAKPVDKSVELIKRLKKDKKKLAIFSSDTKKAVERALEHVSLQGYFNFIVAKEDVEKHKPDGEGLEKIVKKFKVDKNKAIFIGNGYKDKEAGRRAGIATVLVSDLGVEL